MSDRNGIKEEYAVFTVTGAVQDIRLWYTYHDGKCPNCGVDMKSLSPLANIYPHWANQCREVKP